MRPAEQLIDQVLEGQAPSEAVLTELDRGLLDILRREINRLPADLRQRVAWKDLSKDLTVISGEALRRGGDYTETWSLTISGMSLDEPVKIDAAYHHRLQNSRPWKFIFSNGPFARAKPFDSMSSEDLITYAVKAIGKQAGY